MNDHWIDELALSRGGKVGKMRKDAFDIPSSGGTRLPPKSSGQLVQTLVIHNWLPIPLNRTMRGKIADRIQLTGDSHELIAVESFKQGLVKASGARRVQLTVIFPESYQRPDPDNLAKCVLDGLKNCGLLVDDVYELAEWAPPIYWFGTKQTRIELTDIEAKVVRRWRA